MVDVLVDTSVWVDHFRSGNRLLVELLSLDRVWTHPLVQGEIACGTPPARTQTLQAMTRLMGAQQATLREVLVFVEREKLYGLGCGLIDVTLLASTLMTPGLKLWTLDKRLCALAGRFGVMYPGA